MIIILMISSIILLVSAIGVLMWRIVSTKRFPILILIFLILPIGQLFMLYSFRFETWTSFWVVGVLLSLLANVSLLAYTVLYEKKIAAQEELKEAQHKVQLEKAHYNATEKRREELAEMRKGFNEQLNAISALVSDGNEGQARYMIADISDKISLTRENPYCVIPVVNAVIMEKEKECKKAGIELSVNLSIPNSLVVSPMHLCSIFGNILDNAINACKKLQVDTVKPVIRLSSKIDGDYLFIKATNPSDKPNPLPAVGRGYGLRILTDLAKRYGGVFQSNYQDGMFTVVISLLALESAEEKQ